MLATMLAGLVTMSAIDRLAVIRRLQEGPSNAGESGGAAGPD
jgi:hypothetical protein